MSSFYITYLYYYIDRKGREYNAMSLSLITISLYHLNHKLLTAAAYYLADKWFGGQYNTITANITVV